MIELIAYLTVLSYFRQFSDDFDDKTFCVTGNISGIAILRNKAMHESGDL